MNQRNKEFAERKRKIKMNRVHGGPTRGVYGHDVNMMMDGEPMNHKTLMKKRNREAMITNGVMMATPPSAEINGYKSDEWERRRKKRTYYNNTQDCAAKAAISSSPFLL